MSYSAALKAASIWFDRLDGGAGCRYTIKQAIDSYERRKYADNAEGSARSFHCMMYRHIPLELMRVEIDSLIPEMLNSWVLSMVDPEPGGLDPISKSTANLHLMHLRAALNYAWNSGLVNIEKPWSKVKPLKNADKSRELYLSKDQVRALIKYAPGPFKSYITAAVLTGARPGELASIRVNDLVMKHGTLRLIGKTGARTILLSSDAQAFFSKLVSGRNSDEWMLSTEKAGQWHARKWGKQIKSACMAAGFDADTIKQTVAYSLRHYYISRALLAGVSINIVARRCGTSVEIIVKHYAKFLESDEQAMLNRVELI